MKRVVSWRPPLWMVAILMACTLALGTGAGYVQGAANSGDCPESTDVCRKFEDFWTVWNLAEDKFLDPTALKPDEMIAGAINGMLDSLNDRGHTRYQTAEEYQRMQESLNGEFEGIGAYINGESALPTIVAPIEGSPAEAAGVQAGDVILKVDGVSTEGMSIDEVVRRVRGKPGTTVTLQLLHVGEEAPVDVTITRAAVKLPTVTWYMLPDKVAHIRLSEFRENATSEMKRVLKEAKDQGAQKIILDVRDNPGGLLNQAIGVASQFLPEGETVLRVRGRDGKEEIYKSNEPNPETQIPMVVLINSGSASSSEIFAGALQDHGRAKLIGVETRGLGTVLTPIPLEDGSAVYMGTGEWLTPEGHEIRHKGIKPDIMIGLPYAVQPLTPMTEKKLSEAEILATKDTQVQRALNELGVKTTGPTPTPVAPTAQPAP